MPRALLAVSTLALTAGCLPAAPAWMLIPDGPYNLELLRDGQSVARCEVVSWGPNWSWFGFPGQAAVVAGARVAKGQATVAGKPVELTFTLAPAGTSGASLEYRLTAPQGAALTQIVWTINADRASWRGGQLTATLADGKTATAAPIPARGSLGGEVTKLELRGADGQGCRATVSPPRPLGADGQVRVTLAPAQLAPGETLTTKLELTVDGTLQVVTDDAQAVVSNQTPEWFAYPTGPSGVPVDLSFLNKDAAGQWVAAGSHGFLTVRGEGFAFADGTPARFWGTNVTAGAAMATPQRAAQIADRLARAGFNLVRLHHLDSTWGPNLIDRQHPSGTSQHLDVADLDRLDKLIFELKSRGIYVTLDPWVGREYLAGDAVAAWDKLGGGNFGLHPLIFFDPRMQELHQQYLRQIWTHVNPYTGKAYRDEPAIATTEMVNEALFDLGRIARQAPYREQFVALYKQWAAANGANPNSDVVGQNWPADHQRFYIHILRTFYAKQRAFYRDELGLRIPINGSNWFHWPWEIVAHSGQDFMEAHHYYGGDQVGPGSGVGGLWTYHPPAAGDTPFGKIGAMAVLGQPLIASECGNNPPKTYRAAYYPGLAAVACLQGWDGVLPYAWTQGGQPSERLSPFEFESDPASVAGQVAAALIYRRGDVQVGHGLTVLQLDAAEQMAMHWENGGEKAFENTAGFNAALETQRVRVVLGEVPANAAATQVLTPASSFATTLEGSVLRSDTGELQRDWQSGRGSLDTPRTQGVYGTVGGQELALSDTRFALQTPYACAVLSSLDGQPLRAAQRLLLTVAARAENSGQTYNLPRTKITAAGRGPVVCEPVTGEVTFATAAAALTAYPLRVDGSRGAPQPLSIAGGRATLRLMPAAQTLFWVIEP